MRALTAFFVYGTLKRGQENYPLLASYVEATVPAVIAGLLYDLGAYPALVAGSGQVHGELLWVATVALPTVLPLLDHLEDFDPADPVRSLYLRQLVTATTADGTLVEAYTYFYNHDLPGLRPLASGMWPSLPPMPVATTDDSV